MIFKEDLIPGFLYYRVDWLTVQSYCSINKDHCTGQKKASSAWQSIAICKSKTAIEPFHFHDNRFKQVSSVNDADCLQSDLESLQQWEEKWLLQFNIASYI